MIAFIIICFVILIIGLGLLMSYDLRNQVLKILHAIIPSSKKKLLSVRHFAQQMGDASSNQQLQTHWHLQQWWILIAGLLLLSSILMFAFTRQIDPTRVEADYLKEVDPQIYALLNGEMLTPPPEVDEKLVDIAITEAIQLEQKYQAANPDHTAFNLELNNEIMSQTRHGQLENQVVDRKWDRMNPRYKQRLLMVFKIMRERYNYELVLLEGYRSPERQNMLSGNRNTTLAKAYQSYHQFGLAADVAFKRNGKVVISERDPWAMRGYELYGEVAESVGLTWGGRWKSIKDFGHTEYRMPGLKKTAEMAEKLTREGQ
ncbi:M15 family metallopeptidase [Acinetobacter larvae]|uniref:D-alanyl-D-alanine carboxypeptidase n=1 Tax=Acinetobacter larvae TaxID=1789224 RepID=A0A1B2M105_9GAMM|nr:M15 family metallopeptidase [Acinetobacter larvae]AOA58849.1 D-alanyl-D-alanine carboxypeptidase [Acinetobacter larvae]